MVSGRSSGITISTILTSSRDSTPSSIVISSTRSIARPSSAPSTPPPPPPIPQSLSSRLYQASLPPRHYVAPACHRYHRAFDLQVTETSPWVYGAYSSRRRRNMGRPLRPEGGRSL